MENNLENNKNKQLLYKPAINNLFDIVKTNTITTDNDYEYRYALIFDIITQLFNYLVVLIKMETLLVEYDTERKKYIINKIINLSNEICDTNFSKDKNNKEKYFKDNLILSAYTASFILAINDPLINKIAFNLPPEIQGASVLFFYYRVHNIEPSYNKARTNDGYYNNLIQWIKLYKIYVDDIFEEYKKDNNIYKAYIESPGAMKKPISLTNFPDEELTIIKNNVEEVYTNKKDWLIKIWAPLYSLNSLIRIYEELFILLPQFYNKEKFDIDIKEYLDTLNLINNKGLTTDVLMAWRYFFINYLFLRFKQYIKDGIVEMKLGGIGGKQIKKTTSKIPQEDVRIVQNTIISIYNNEESLKKNKIFILDIYNLLNTEDYKEVKKELNIGKDIKNEDKEKLFKGYWQLYINYKATNKKPEFLLDGKYIYSKDTFNKLSQFLNGFDTYCNNLYEEYKKNFSLWKEYIIYKKKLESYNKELESYNKKMEPYNKELEKHEEYITCSTTKFGASFRCTKVEEPKKPSEIIEPEKPIEPKKPEGIEKINDQALLNINPDKLTQDLDNWIQEICAYS